MNGVALAYSGVHQIFQLALAAHEMGELDGLFCSLVDGPGKWGRRLGRWIPNGTVRPLGANALPPERITEFPWPVLANRLGKRWLGARSDHRRSNGWFDHTAAKWLRTREARVFVGAESCALESLRTAKSRGMKAVLECPGIPSVVLDEEARKAAEVFSVTIPFSSNSAAMLERKKQELAEAELVICCSEFQRDKLVELNPCVKQTEVIPLWSDVSFWRTARASRQWSVPGTPLRVLYAGGLSLRKGVPYLLQTVEPLRDEVILTLVGAESPEMRTILPRFRAHRHMRHVPKAELRDLYASHDVLVMPTLGDSFGFVTVEAMAAGLPVIASRNAGAPVPDENWRVPPHDAEAIRERLLAYHRDRDLLRHDAERATEFADHLRPEDYRAKAQSLFSRLLAL